MAEAGWSARPPSESSRHSLWNEYGGPGLATVRCSWLAVGDAVLLDPGGDAVLARTEGEHQGAASVRVRARHSAGHQPGRSGSSRRRETGELIPDRVVGLPRPSGAHHPIALRVPLDP